MTLSRRWLIGGIAAAIALFALGYVLLVNPARDRANQLNVQADNLNEENRMLALKLDTLRRQSAEVPAKLEQIEAVKLKMPGDIRQPGIVRTVERLAGSAGVDLTGIAPDTPTALEGSETGTVVLPVAITATGSYPQIKTFVDLLQRQERAFLIISLEVARGEGTAEDFALTVNGNYFSLPAGALNTPSAGSQTDEPQAAASARMPRRKG